MITAMSRIFVIILVSMLYANTVWAQETDKYVTFWDKVRQEPFGIISYCYDAKGNDLVLEAFENAFPLIDDAGRIKLKNTDIIETIKVRGVYYNVETFDASNGIPDTIKVDPSSWAFYKFIGYYYPEESVCDTTFTKGLLIASSDSEDVVNVMVVGGTKDSKKVWFGPTGAAIDEHGHLLFCCGGVDFMIVSKDLFTIEVKQTNSENRNERGTSMDDCPVKPGTYKRINRDLRLR